MLSEKLKIFLEKSKHKITQSQITICMGNEGCDLDSFISSLIVSYAENFIPVVPIKKSVFLTKGDLIYVCKKFKIEINDLIFIEKPLGSFSSSARRHGLCFLVNDNLIHSHDKIINLVLTDHNQPMEELSLCNVEMIIDHHLLSENINKAKRIYIDIDVGSATTLVSKYLGHDLEKKTHCFNLVKQINKKINKNSICAELAKLILIPILIDTNFLKRRASSFDYFEYKKLKKISGCSKKELLKDYKNIKKERKNDYLFETSLILQKDFKKYFCKDYNFGMSVVKYKFDKWIDREVCKIKGLDENKQGMALYLQLQSFKSEMGLDFYCISTKIKGIRTMLIIDFPFIKDLLSRIEMKRIDYKGMPYYKIDVKMTRKVFIPILYDIIDKHTQ